MKLGVSKPWSSSIKDGPGHIESWSGGELAWSGVHLGPRVLVPCIIGGIPVKCCITFTTSLWSATTVVYNKFIVYSTDVYNKFKVCYCNGSRYTFRYTTTLVSNKFLV